MPSLKAPSVRPARGAPARSWAARSCAIALLVLPAALAAGAETDAERGLLWSVEKGDERGFLLGSLHFFREDLYPLPAPVEAAYRKAAVVVFEANPAALERPDFQARVAARGILPEGERLRDRLEAEEFRRLARQAGALGVTPEGLDRMQPWLAAVALAGLEMMRLGLDPTHGIDRHFHQRAVRDGKGRLYLEDLDFQIALLADLGEEEAVAFLRQSLEELEGMDERLEELVAAWGRGDREELTGIVLNSLEPYPTLRERFLTARNRDWIPALRETLAAGEPVLVVVGAGHLLGEGSVVELLRRAGYTVEPH